MLSHLRRQCLICDKALLESAERRSIFRCRSNMDDIRQALSDRLEVILDAKLVETQAHSDEICHLCETQMVQIEEYFRLLIIFRETYRTTLKRHAQIQTSAHQKRKSPATDNYDSVKKASESKILRKEICADNSQGSYSRINAEENTHRKKSDARRHGSDDQINATELEGEITFTVKGRQSMSMSSDEENNDITENSVDCLTPDNPIFRLQGTQEEKDIVESNSEQIKETNSLLNSKDPIFNTECASKHEAYGKLGDGSSVQNMAPLLDISEKRDNIETSSEEAMLKVSNQGKETGQAKKVKQLTEKSFSLDKEGFSKNFSKSQTLRFKGKRKFRCMTCSKHFSTMRNLKRHQSVHSADKHGKIHVCPVCSVKFSHKVSLRSHVKFHKTKGITILSCEGCFSTFSNQENLKQHLEVECQGKKHHKCPDCDKLFRCRSEIQNHLHLHQGQRPFQCKVCEKTFARKQTLAEHERVHKDVRPYKCLTCDETFKFRSNLKEHTLKHSDCKPHHCSECPSRFLSLTKLNKHLKVHLKDTPFLCSVCGYGFKQRSSLQYHMSTHSSNKPFTCITCSASFKRADILQRHMLRHTGEKPHKCPQCDASYCDRKSLNNHILTHSNAKPYVCKSCEKSFNDKKALKKHEVLHTGEKAYKCDACEKAFALPQYLTRHMKIHDKSSRPYNPGIRHKRQKVPSISEKLLSQSIENESEIVQTQVGENMPSQKELTNVAPQSSEVCNDSPKQYSIGLAHLTDPSKECDSIFPLQRDSSQYNLEPHKVVISNEGMIQKQNDNTRHENVTQEVVSAEAVELIREEKTVVPHLIKSDLIKRGQDRSPSPEPDPMSSVPSTSDTLMPICDFVQSHGTFSLNYPSQRSQIGQGKAILDLTPKVASLSNACNQNIDLNAQESSRDLNIETQMNVPLKPNSLILQEPQNLSFSPGKLTAFHENNVPDGDTRLVKTTLPNSYQLIETQIGPGDMPYYAQEQFLQEKILSDSKLSHNIPARITQTPKRQDFQKEIGHPIHKGSSNKFTNSSPRELSIDLSKEAHLPLREQIFQGSIMPFPNNSQLHPHVLEHEYEERGYSLQSSSHSPRPISTGTANFSVVRPPDDITQSLSLQPSLVDSQNINHYQFLSTQSYSQNVAETTGRASPTSGTMTYYSQTNSIYPPLNPENLHSSWTYRNYWETPEGYNTSSIAPPFSHSVPDPNAGIQSINRSNPLQANLDKKQKK